METTMTSAPVSSFNCRAASTAFRSSGLVMVAIEARFRVPSSLTATLPEVSGTCLTQTMIFMSIFLRSSINTQVAGDDHTLDLSKYPHRSR